MLPNARRTAVITGASKGIGRELARLFAREKYDLVLVARSADLLERLGAELSTAHGTRSHILTADLADPSAPGAIAEQLREVPVAVDVLVNNAGYGTYGPFASTDLVETLGLLRVNILALTHLTRLFLPAMLERGAGRILNVASTAAFQAGPLMAAYYASKAYVLHFSEALAEELRGTGVMVTALCPGPTRTEFHRRARMESAKLVRWTPFVMDTASVARAGYEGLMRGKRLVIPGLTNRILAQVVRFVPRVVPVKIAGALNAS
jgi:uncharacterized protein